MDNLNEGGCSQDWISYSDTKCYKVLGKKGTELESKGNCSQLDNSSTLITIQSKEEQNFLSNRLKDYKNISDFVWIGLEFNDKAFKWMDGNAVEFENWGENAMKDGKSKCVQMSLADSELGKWTDDNCQKKYQIICQKKQSTNTVISDEVNNLTKVVDKQQELIEKLNKEQQDLTNKLDKTIDKLIPLGFLYTQLPNQSTPQQLWPNMEWTEITQQYAGLFFRAEGSGSDTFGTVQGANYSRLLKLNVRGCDISGYSNCKDQTGILIEEGKWENIHPNIHGLISAIYPYMTTGENRPRNTAIKIFKRIK